ncbi:MAG: hypothetical protein ABIH92_00275, partial [Nanoarchaeota archaeon]
VVSFVLFIVLATVGIAFLYSSQIKDTIKFNQIESFSQKVVSLSESIFYAGEPSRTVMTGYLPKGIKSIEILSDYIVFNVSSSGGESVVAYKSNVNLTGSISPNSGLRKIYLNATDYNVIVSD